MKPHHHHLSSADSVGHKYRHMKRRSRRTRKRTWKMGGGMY